MGDDQSGSESSVTSATNTSWTKNCAHLAAHAAHDSGKGACINDVTQVRGSG